ncbi:MAG TPA: hypothetical protein VM074_11900 [Solimonas sp.]|nr:hypothetical protein [Solimonas sp.]
MAETLLALACIAGAALSGGCALRLHVGLAEMQRRLARIAVLQEERRRYLDAKQRVAAVQQASEAVVQIGTQTVRGVHEAIAAIPFTILESIPATREPAKVVRAVHDLTAKGVYGAIGAVNRLVGKGLRQALDVEVKDRKAQDVSKGP